MTTLQVIQTLLFSISFAITFVSSIYIVVWITMKLMEYRKGREPSKVWKKLKPAVILMIVLTSWINVIYWYTK